MFELILFYNTKSSKTLIFKCSPFIRKHIKDLDDKITIEYHQCKVFDNLHVTQCSKCCKFGHSKTSCKASSDTCTICVECHTYVNCPVKNDKTKHKCVNCINQNYPDTSHSAFSTLCPIMKSEKIKLISKTDFGIPNPFTNI